MDFASLQGDSFRKLDIDDYRDRIEELYMDRSNKIEDVMRIMSAEHNFKASRRQYYKKIREWGLARNVRNEEYWALVRIAEQRQSQGKKKTQFSLRGQVVDAQKLDRFQRQHQTRPESTIATPPNLSIYTPQTTVFSPEYQPQQNQALVEEASHISPLHNFMDYDGVHDATLHPEVDEMVSRHPTMQHDTDLTIGDIVLDLRDSGNFALGQSWEHPVLQETHMNLRFLRIPHLEQYSDLYPEVTCELTEKGDYPGVKCFVAVSYCWESFTTPHSTADQRSSPLSSTVLIEERGKPPRPPRCPPQVLVRAIAFAISKGVSLIWIDQECVDQKDPIDIQNHMQCNHIFDQAEFKIGLLSYQLTNTQVKHLNNLELFRLMDDPRLAPALVSYGLKSILKDIHSMTRLLRSIGRDRWFTRTWVLQERISSHVEMRLLVPLSTTALEKYTDDQFSEKLVGEDYPLGVKSIFSIAVVIRLCLSAPELAKTLQEDIALKNAVYDSLNSLHEAAQHLSGPIFSGAPFDRVFGTFGLDKNLEREIYNIRGFPIYQNFLQMENCDNRDVSDRVAIFSNIMGFRERFLTHSFKSYSFSLVALLSANDCIPSLLIEEETQTRSALYISHPVLASGLIMLAYQLKELMPASQKEFEHVSGALTNFFGRDITQHTEFWDAVEDAVEGLPEAYSEDPLMLLSEIEMPTLKRWDVIPLSASIGDLIGGIVPEDHIDNVGLQLSHGDSIIEHGIKTNQLRQGVKFLAFCGEYRWRSTFVEKFFD